jgi:hypothetical protein
MRGSSCVLYAAATRHDRKEERLPDLAQALEGAPSVQLVAFINECGPVEERAYRLQHGVVVLQKVID